MAYGDDLANELKKRNNPKIIDPQIGIVKSVSPLKVSLYDGQLILDSDNALLCKNLLEGAKSDVDIKINAYSVGVSATDSRGDTISTLSVNTKSNYDAQITYKNVLKVGDMVLCIAASNRFIIVDKVEVV